ncbi:MAG: RidA family protein [Nostoc indistinguendum CM1-VF10]|jgi:enamine deaminase RidA (YjgF/YER057c/UK114 family)|nr:RidA family protein [Nostoc indistinguendum CM1-VF10]
MVQQIQHLNPAGFFDPSHYGFTHVVTVPANTTLIYIAGQLGMDERGNLVAADFAAQLKQAFANLRAALAAVGATPEDVVKITVLSVDHDAEKQQLISAARNDRFLNLHCRIVAGAGSAGWSL